MSKSTLTDRQREVLGFIAECIRERGYPPTVREIGTRFGIRSPQGVMCHLKALERRGWIIREPHQARAIRLLRNDEQAAAGTDNGV